MVKDIVSLIKYCRLEIYGGNLPIIQYLCAVANVDIKQQTTKEQQHYTMHVKKAIYILSNIYVKFLKLIQKQQMNVETQSQVRNKRQPRKNTIIMA